MVRLKWFLFLLVLMLGATSALAAAASAEERAFSVALGKFYTSPELSENDFADFVRKYPNSIRVPEAVLYQAQAMISSGQITNAIELLSTNRADKLAPQYLYWLARARFQNQDYARAADSFGEMLQKFPESPRALDATVREAGALSRLEQWPRVVQLLQATNGLFQRSLRAGAVSETIASGFLLLGEAQLAQGNAAAVEETLRSLDKQTLSTSLRWQRDYLAARVQRLEGRLDDALRNASSLLLTEDRTNRAEGVAFQAGVLEQTGNLDGAATVYTNNLAPGVPPAQQRRAILKIAELDMKLPGKLPEAVQSLTNYLQQFPPPEAADLALLTLGEVRLKQAVSGETNLFQNAFAQFEHLVNFYTNSPWVGKAWLDEGWCLWSENKIAESQGAFRQAVEHLPVSEEQAEARFKWADTQFELKDYSDAVTNYNSIAEKYQSLQQANDKHLIERALYQAARAALNEPKPDTVAATSALKNILQWYPNGLFGPAALLLTGQGLTEKKNPAAARALFAQFEQLYPTNELLPEIRLAVARSYEAERDWDAAITNYAAWTASFPRHPLLPQATFNLALDHYLAGRETNALVLFTNFIARFPTNLLAARAQYWAGDYYFRQGDWLAAENNYQLVFQNTNWLTSTNLIYDARMMAGKSAMARFAYGQAINYFNNLFRPDCPKPLQVQATMAYADATISQDSTNKTADLNEAIKSLKTILQTESDTPEAALARGRIGDCYFALGATDPDQYTNAALYYRQVFESPGGSSAARNEARFKLGATMEKQAALKTGAEQTALFKQALDQYVDVFYQGLNDSEKPSPLWTKKSGMAAAQLAEALQQWPVAIKLYQQLKDLLPVLAPSCDKKIAKAREHLM